MGRPLGIGVVVSALVLGAASFVAAQQAPPIKRIPLQKYDVPGTKLETVVGIAEIAPNVLIGRHTHPGAESGYLLEFVLMVDGQPPKPLKAGESYQIPPGTIHDAKSGAGSAKVLAVYIVRKGEPRLRQSSATFLRYGRRDNNAAPMAWRHVDDQLTQNRFTYPSTN